MPPIQVASEAQCNELGNRYTDVLDQGEDWRNLPPVKWSCFDAGRSTSPAFIGTLNGSVFTLGDPWFDGNHYRPALMPDPMPVYPNEGSAGK